MSNPNDAQDKFNLRCADAVELVTDYLDKALDEGDLVRFEAHLAVCEGCSVYLLQIKTTVRLTGMISDDQSDELPANFDALVEMLRDRG